MKLHVLVTGVLFAMTSTLAWAGSQEQISYEEAVAKCQEFVNDPQLVTIEFKVSCFAESYQWRVTGEQPVSRPNEGSLGHRILMKEKWYTPDFAVPVVMEASESSCPVLSQFRTARQAELVLSCDDFVQNYANPEDLASRCDEVLDSASAQTEATGQVFSPCASAIR